jgi:hypothetical protein
MKRTVVSFALGLAFLGLPALAQDSPRPAALEQAADTLRDLAPTEDQAQGLMELFLRQLPRIMDENADPISLAKEVAPDAERLLNTDQVRMLREISKESGPVQFGTMTREERRRLVQGGLERLSHPDMKEWLKRIDSFDI